MIIALIGGTGLVGSHVIKKLIKEDQVSRVILILRRKSELDSSKVQEVILDEFTEKNLEDLNIKADAFLSCLGTTIKKAGSKEEFVRVDKKLSLAFARKAKKQDASFYIVSAMGANSSSIFFYNKVKGELEEELMKMNFRKLKIYKPSLLIGERKEKRILEAIGVKLYRELKLYVNNKFLLKMGTEVNDLSSQILTDILN